MGGVCINIGSSLFHRAMWRSDPCGLWSSCPYSWHYPNVHQIFTLSRINNALVKRMPSIFCDIRLGRDRPAKYLGRCRWNDDTVGDCLRNVWALPLCRWRRRLWPKGVLVALSSMLPLSVTNRCLKIGRSYLSSAGIMRLSRPRVGQSVPSRCRGLTVRCGEVPGLFKCFCTLMLHQKWRGGR